MRQSTVSDEHTAVKGEKGLTLRERCPVLQFSDLGDERGKLVVIEGAQAIPFEIKRVFYIYDSET